MISFINRRGVFTALLTGALLTISALSSLPAQGPSDNIIRIDLPTGRSMPITAPSGVTRISVANPDIADAIAVSGNDVVLNAKAAGETDVLLWLANGPVRHYRVQVRSPADRMQILLGVKFAEVRRDMLTNVGVSGLYKRDNVRVGTGVLRSDANFDETGKLLIPSEGNFLTVLTDFGTKDFLALLELQARKGNARILAEPNIMAGNREEAAFLAGGEIPIPIAQAAGVGAFQTVTIQYREFGVRLNFVGEIISDSLIRLKVRPEVSTLDYSNAVVLSGFRIPALRTRRVESTLDVKRSQSLVISGLLNDEREKVRTGIPLLMDLPILGNLFSSTSWQRNETELLVVVTPIIIDPMNPRRQDVLRFKQDSLPPAMESIGPRLAVPPARPQ